MSVRAVKVIGGYRTSVNVGLYGDGNTIPVTFEGNPTTTKFTVKNQVLLHGNTYYFAPGTYTYTASAEGYITIINSFSVSNVGITVYANLSTGVSGGVLTVNSTPQDAQVYLDSNYVGVTPITLSDVTEGVHTFKVSALGKQSQEGTITIASGESKSLDIILQDAYASAGTYVDSICKDVGTVWTLYNRYADGSGGLTEVRVKDYATECGYVAPETGTLLVTSTPGNIPFSIVNESGTIIQEGTTIPGNTPNNKSSSPVSFTVFPGVYTIRFNSGNNNYKSTNVNVNVPVNSAVEAWGKLPSKVNYTVSIDVSVRTNVSAIEEISWFISGNKLIFQSTGNLYENNAYRYAMIGSEIRGSKPEHSGSGTDFNSYVGLTGNIVGLSVARTSTLQKNNLCTSIVSDTYIACSSEMYWASPSDAGAGARISVNLWAWSDESAPTNSTTTTYYLGEGGSTNSTRATTTASGYTVTPITTVIF